MNTSTAPSVSAERIAQLEGEIARLVVDTLMLEDVDPASIDPAAPLFGDAPGSLGLDSIDVLELAMALHKRYGVRTRSDDDRNREIFHSVRSLARFVAENTPSTEASP